LRLPSSSARNAFVARIASAASSGRDVKRAARVTLSSRRDVDERAEASAEDLRAQAEEAIVREWAIELKYLRVGDEDPSWRTVSPQTVVSAERPYLVAWDHAKSALRNYRLDRMQRVTRAEGVAFREVSAAVVDAHVRESFHGYRGGELREVSWVFSDEAWATAKDNLPFACERREPVPGGVRVVVKSRGGDVLVRFLLAYGARVTIETPRVRDEVIALARKALAWHEAQASGRGADEASGGSRDTPAIRGDE
jgi:predicted DNA-binding transcriptional regulator YafY